MAQPLKLGYGVTLKFPHSEYPETYRIRGIQEKPGQVKIFFIPPAPRPRSEFLTITRQGTEYSGEIQPIDITYIYEDMMSRYQHERDELATELEEDHIANLTTKLAHAEDMCLDAYEYASYFWADVMSSVEHRYIGALRMIAANNIEGFRQSGIAYEAAASGALDILKWVDSFDPPIPIEDVDGDLFTIIVLMGRLEMLKYLHESIEDDFIEREGLALLSVSEHTFYPGILKWIYEVNPEHVEKYGSELPNMAAKHGHVEAITYLESLDPPIRPNKEGIEDARRNNHLDIVDYLESVPLTKSANKR
jgi:hypothetical protein